MQDSGVWLWTLGAILSALLFVLGAFQALSFWVLNSIKADIREVKTDGFVERDKREELERCVNRIKRQLAIVEERCVFRHSRKDDPPGTDFSHERWRNGIRKGTEPKDPGEEG